MEDHYTKQQKKSEGARKLALLETYRQAKYPTLEEARAAVHDNIDDLKGPRNFLDLTQGMPVNVSGINKFRDQDTGRLVELQTTGDIIEKNSAHHIGIGGQKDQIAAQNIDTAVGIASHEQKMTQRRETENFVGDAETLTTQIAKHQVEQTYFEARHAELVENRVPRAEEEAFQKAYTRYSQASRADLIKQVEQQYPVDTRAIQADYQPSYTQDQSQGKEAAKVSMRPNRDGFSSLEKVKARLAAYEARRNTRGAGQSPAVDQTSNKIMAGEQSHDAAIATHQDILDKMMRSALSKKNAPVQQSSADSQVDAGKIRKNVCLSSQQ